MSDKRDKGEQRICPECGQERFEIELAHSVWWGCGCGDHLTAMAEREQEEDERCDDRSS